jgi:O-antigen/teichoic acid export membrane protein
MQVRSESPDPGNRRMMSLVRVTRRARDEIVDKRASLMRYVTSTASMGIGLVAHTIGFVILAKTLGPLQFGLLTIITTVANFGLVWSGLGSGELLRRKVARDRATYPEVLGHAVSILTLTGATIGVALAIGLAFTVEVADDFFTNLLVMLLFVASNMTMFAWINLTEQILLAHNDVARANLVNVASGLGRAIAAIVACYVFKITQLQQWVFWHFGFYLIIAVGCTIAIGSLGRPSVGIIWGELRRGLTITATALFMFMRRNADVLALAAVAPPSVVGVYGVARRIVGTADVVSASLDRLVYSNLAVAGAKGAGQTLRLASRYALIAAVLCGATSIALLIVAPWVPVVFGKQFADAVLPTQILAGVLILTSLQNLASDALNAAEQHEMRFVAETSAGLAGTGLLVALTLAFALPGILFAIYLSGLLGVVALWSMLIWLAAREKKTSP